jgi:hypothetical protein
MWFGGVDAVFNARGVVCGCVNGAWKFTPHARVMYLENNKQVKSRVRLGWMNSASYKLTKAIGFGEERGPTWPFGTHHDGGRWWCGMLGYICASTNHTRLKRSKRRELGLKICKNLEFMNTYRQTPHKSP